MKAITIQVTQEKKIHPGQASQEFLVKYTFIFFISFLLYMYDNMNCPVPLNFILFLWLHLNEFKKIYI